MCQAHIILISSFKCTPSFYSNINFCAENTTNTSIRSCVGNFILFLLLLRDCLFCCMALAMARTRHSDMHYVVIRVLLHTISHHDDCVVADAILLLVGIPRINHHIDFFK